MWLRAGRHRASCQCPSRAPYHYEHQRLDHTRHQRCQVSDEYSLQIAQLIASRRDHITLGDDPHFDLHYGQPPLFQAGPHGLALGAPPSADAADQSASVVSLRRSGLPSFSIHELELPGTGVHSSPGSGCQPLLKSGSPNHTEPFRDGTYADPLHDNMTLEDVGLEVDENGEMYLRDDGPPAGHAADAIGDVPAYGEDAGHGSILPTTEQPNVSHQAVCHDENVLT